MNVLDGLRTSSMKYRARLTIYPIVVKRSIWIVFGAAQVANMELRACLVELRPALAVSGTARASGALVRPHYHRSEHRQR